MKTDVFFEMFIRLKPERKKVLANSIYTALAAEYGEQKAWRIARNEFGINRKWLPVLGKMTQDLSDIPEQKQQARSYNVVVSINLA